MLINESGFRKNARRYSTISVHAKPRNSTPNVKKNIGTSHWSATGQGWVMYVRLNSRKSKHTERLQEAHKPPKGA